MWAGLALGLLASVGAVANDLWLVDWRPTPTSWAEERADDPQSVLPLCLAAPNVSPERLGLCAGYIKAIAHVLARDAVEGSRACIPRGTTLGQLLEAVVGFAKRNPELVRQMATNALVARAMASGFPCPR